MNKLELAQTLNTTVCMVETNFPMVKAKALRNGLLIIKEGRGNNAVYTIEKTTPQNVSNKEFSTRQKIYWEEDAPDEVWTTTYQNINYEVSNLGRVRNKQDLSLRKPGLNDRGYYVVSMDDKKYTLHRIVLSSFDPVPNLEELTVDHIDGDRSNNKLNNLRWATNKENIQFMTLHRAELNKELTRLLQGHSYDEVLQMLQQLS